MESLLPKCAFAFKRVQLSTNQLARFGLAFILYYISQYCCVYLLIFIFILLICLFVLTAAPVTSSYMPNILPQSAYCPPVMVLMLMFCLAGWLTELLPKLSFILLAFNLLAFVCLVSAFEEHLY